MKNLGMYGGTCNGAHKLAARFLSVSFTELLESRITAFSHTHPCCVACNLIRDYFLYTLPPSLTFSGTFTPTLSPFFASVIDLCSICMECTVDAKSVVYLKKWRASPTEIVPSVISTAATDILLK